MSYLFIYLLFFINIYLCFTSIVIMHGLICFFLFLKFIIANPYYFILFIMHVNGLKNKRQKILSRNLMRLVPFWKNLSCNLLFPALYSKSMEYFDFICLLISISNICTDKLIIVSL